MSKKCKFRPLLDCHWDSCDFIFLGRIRLCYHYQGGCKFSPRRVSPVSGGNS